VGGNLLIVIGHGGTNRRGKGDVREVVVMCAGEGT